LSVSEDLADRVVSLPLYPELTDAEVEHVAAVLSEVALAVA
jgi:dTDP-4-amino-4,6-dideoxygalactose transaminase